MVSTGFTRIATLTGHNNVVSGIVFPTGFHILYTASKDGTLRAWDAHTGKCVEYIDLGGEIECMICEQAWIFVGGSCAVLVWNTQTCQRLRLEGPRGRVYAMGVSQNTLFVACEDGNILAYEPNRIKKTFIHTATLKGHETSVLSLAVTKEHLYSGSEDGSIRRWDSLTFQCTHVVEGHSGPVASLIRWEGYLFTGSLDNTMKVWAATNDKGLKTIHTDYQKQGVIAFTETKDAADKPILFVSSSDDYVCMYTVNNKLEECGRLYTKDRVTTLTFSEGFLFTGDTSGNIDVWKWQDQP